MKPVGAYDPTCCYDATEYAKALERRRNRAGLRWALGIAENIVTGKKAVSNYPEEWINLAVDALRKAGFAAQPDPDNESIAQAFLAWVCGKGKDNG